MADIACPVCHSINASTRTFCWKCAADLRAPVTDPGAAPPPPKVEVPMRPVLVGGGVALVAIALIAILFLVLRGAPGPTSSPSLAPTALPTASPSPTAAVTPPPATEPPATEAPPATPEITPVPAPSIVSFEGPETVDCNAESFDGFITLTWEVSDADSTTLSIDGPGVYISYPGVAGSDQVPFSCGSGQHTYTLTTVGGSGEPASKTLTITEG